MTVYMIEYRKTIQDNHIISDQADIIVIFIIIWVHFIYMAIIIILRNTNHFDSKSFLRCEIK